MDSKRFRIGIKIG